LKTRSRAAAELTAGREAVRQVLVADEVLGYIVDHRRGRRDTRRPLPARCVAARRDGACWPPARSWGLAVGPHYYVTPDDVKGDGAAEPYDIGSRFRPEAELEGANPDGVLDGILAGRGPVPALVILTGRAGLIALICVLPLAISNPGPQSPFGRTAGGVWWLVIVVDRGAGRQYARALNCSRLGETTARAGARPSTRCWWSENPNGQRRFRGQIRDAWAPSAPRGATHTSRQSRRGPTGSSRLTVAAGSAAATSNPRLFTARSVGPLGSGRSAELTPGAVADPDHAAVPVTQASCRRGWPSLRELEGMTPVPDSGVRAPNFDSLREYVHRR